MRIAIEKLILWESPKKANQYDLVDIHDDKIRLLFYTSQYNMLIWFYPSKNLYSLLMKIIFTPPILSWVLCVDLLFLPFKLLQTVELEKRE
jgi:hypothetical protein